MPTAGKISGDNMTDQSRLAVLEKTTELQEDRLNSLSENMSTLATEFRGCIEKLTAQLATMNATLANMKGFWAGAAFALSLLGAGTALVLGKILDKVWP